MPALKDPRHEKFAQAIAAGKPGAEAYVGAGFADNKQARSASTRLKKNRFVARRIVELNKAVTTRAQERAVIDKARIMEELETSLLQAREDKQHSASVRAAELLGREIGMFVEQTKTEHSGGLVIGLAEALRERRQKRIGPTDEDGDSGV